MAKKKVDEAPQFRDEDFRKSSFSPSTWKPWRCVMVAKKDGVVTIRDSKDHNKSTLVFTEGEWDAFLKGVKTGEFDL